VATIDLATLEARANRTAEVDNHGAITPSEARRLACDAHIARFITGPSSEILDLGRSTRIPNQARRRAIRVRDRGCAVPGCDAAPGWCDIHHIRYWTRDHGPTDLDNLIMCCHAHHTMIHNNQLTIQTDGGRFTFKRADGTTIKPEPDPP